MAVTQPAYNSPGTAITMTNLSTLASSATVGIQSAPIDNSSNKYIDAVVTVSVTTSASSLAAPNVCYCYISPAFDGVPTFNQDSATINTTTSGSYTIDTLTNLRQAGPINCSTSSKTYNISFSVAQVCGVMPLKWILFITNQTGQALTGATVSYCGITYTTT